MILPCDPNAGYLRRKTEIDAAVIRVMDGRNYILGPEVEAFEGEFAAYCESSFCVGVANGTEAIQLALRALGVGPGDEVLTVSHTAVATAAAVEMAGAKPVFADVHYDTCCIDIANLEQYLTPRTRAIIAVHLYGHPADLDTLKVFAERYKLKLIEDCAQAHGALYKGRRVGSFGDAACFSFYPTKNLGAIGDGGAVVTNTPEIFAQLKLLRQYGWKKRYISEISGYNSRLDEIQAAILRIKLRHLDDDNNQRRNLAKIYDRLLVDSSVITPQVETSCHHVYHLYVVKIANLERSNVLAALKDRGIFALVHYPAAVHEQPAYKSMCGVRSLPVTEQLVGEVLSLPMYPELPEESVVTVAEQLCEICPKG